MTTGTGGEGPAGDGLAEAGGREPAAGFGRELRAAVRYEAGLAVKGAAVLAVLAVLLVLRALFLG